MDACGEKIAESSCCDSVVDAVAAVAWRVMGEAGWERCVFVGNMPDSRLSRKNHGKRDSSKIYLVHFYRMSRILARFENMTLVAFGRQTQQTNNSTSFLVLLPAWRFRILSKVFCGKVTLMNH